MLGKNQVSKDKYKQSIYHWNRHTLQYLKLLRISIVSKQFVVKQTYLCQKVLIYSNVVSCRLWHTYD